MDTQGNSRLQGHPGQPPHPLDQLKSLAKENCCYHLENWCSDMCEDLKDMGKNLKDMGKSLKDMGKSLKNAFRPERARNEARDTTEKTANEFLNLNRRHTSDHTFRVFHPEPEMAVG
ncbi:hypothetical protein NW768_000756 [Fusarium equiseti]|uniref:Uncharacterized protein n=1 Tax=Fusarium equiseti TaxID=61235 RepID=A0ABQ8RTS8_FUSEQ|nr:hypothetical protein NW768_000756 [Fusarium equiseti]